jgi:hypothetical protein
MLAALPAAFLPYHWMDAIHQRAGLGQLPEVPIVGYLARSLSAFYAMHGALFVFLARDVRAYLPVIRFLAIAGIVFGAGVFWLDAAVGMPRAWTLAEGPYAVVLSAVLLWLACAPSRRDRPESEV